MTRKIFRSILLAAAVCLLVQRLTPAQTLQAALLGFRAGDAQVAAMLTRFGEKSI